MLTTICVFCASSPGVDPRQAEAARAFGEMLAQTGRRVVYGGGNTGLMGALADGVLSARGEIVGVMPRHLVEREVAHRGLTRLDIVTTMHERKARLAEMADAFVALPGGLGTLEEFADGLDVGPARTASQAVRAPEHGPASTRRCSNFSTTRSPRVSCGPSIARWFASPRIRLRSSTRWSTPRRPRCPSISIAPRPEPVPAAAPRRPRGSWRSERRNADQRR